MSDGYLGGLKNTVSEFWPRFSEAEVTHQWRGLICLTKNLCPAIGRLTDDESVYYSFGYQGNGVASATWQGRVLARCIGSSTSGLESSYNDLPSLLRGPTPKIPLAFLRRHYVVAGQLVYRLRDRFGP